MADLALYPGGRQRVIDYLTTCLEKVTEENDVCRPGRRLQERESVFDMMVKLRYAARSFLSRLPCRLPDCGARSFVVAFVYLDRFLRRRCHSITLDSFNVRRLLLTSLLTATKFELGFGYNNSLFARIGRIKLKDMNNMESAFLDGIDFHRTVEDDDFNNYCARLLFHGTIRLNSEIAQPISSAYAPSNLKIIQSISSASAPSDSDITQPISSTSAPTSTLVLPCCIYIEDTCDCSKQKKPLE